MKLYGNTSMCDDMFDCPHCGLRGAHPIHRDAQDGLGRTWDEWWCGFCDEAWEENVEIEPGSYMDKLNKSRQREYDYTIERT